MDCRCRDRDILRAAVGVKGYRDIPVEGVKGQNVEVVNPKKGIVWRKFSPRKLVDPTDGEPLETEFLNIAAAHKKAGLL